MAKPCSMMRLNCETCVGDGGQRRSMGMHQKRKLKEIPAAWSQYGCPLGEGTLGGGKVRVGGGPERKRSTMATMARRPGRRWGVLAMLPRVSVRRLVSIVFF